MTRLTWTVDSPWTAAAHPPTACPPPPWTSLRLPHSRLDNRSAVAHTVHSPNDDPPSPRRTADPQNKSSASAMSPRLLVHVHRALLRVHRAAEPRHARSGPCQGSTRFAPRRSWCVFHTRPDRVTHVSVRVSQAPGPCSPRRRTCQEGARSEVSRWPPVIQSLRAWIAETVAGMSRRYAVSARTIAETDFSID